MIGQPLPQQQTVQDWNDFVNEMRFWMNSINTTIARIQAESGVSPEYVQQQVDEGLRQAKAYTDRAMRNVFTIDEVNVSVTTDLWTRDGDVYKATVRDAAFTEESIPMLTFNDSTLELIADFGVSSVCETGAGTLTLTAIEKPTVNFEGIAQIIS